MSRLSSEPALSRDVQPVLGDARVEVGDGVADSVSPPTTILKPL
jgi:hypothetical protein